MVYDRAQATAAIDEAAAALDTTQETEEVRVAASPDEAFMVPDAPARYCPAPLPCLGMTGVHVRVPVRIVSAPAGATHVPGALAGEVDATYCPACRAFKADRQPPVPADAAA